MWPFKMIVLEKWALFWGFQHTFIVFSKDIDGKTFIFQLILGMWPLKLIIYFVEKDRYTCMCYSIISVYVELIAHYIMCQKCL